MSGPTQRPRRARTRGRALACLLAVACVPREGDDDRAPDRDGEAGASQGESPSADGEVVADEDAGAHPPGSCEGLPTSSGLSLELLATLAAKEADQGRAVVRDPQSGTVATYRYGETIRDGIVLAAVGSGCVVIERDGVRETVTMDGGGTTRLQPDDVFYPDLLEPDDLSGSMADAVPLQEGPGYVVKRPEHAWGTPKTVAVLREAIRAYRRRHPDAPDVHVGDISLRNGGPFPPHLSHQTGRDVDIGYVLSGWQAHDKQFRRASSRNLDLERTWDLLQSFLDTGAVAYVFIDYDIQRLLYDHVQARGADPTTLATLFQYPRGRHAAHGIIRHWRGHENHLHVRFRS